MEYEIHFSGSSGNSNIIYGGGYKFLVDIGKPYKYIKEMGVQFVDFLLITHKHSDHLNVSAYNRLLNDYPNIKVITNKEVQEHLIKKGATHEVDYIIESGLTIDIDGVRINFIENLHGVDTQGYIFEENEKTLLYATDLSNTAYYEQWLDVEKRKIDVCLLENNYDLQKLLDLDLNHTGYNVHEAQSRHLNHDDYEKFIGNYCKVDCIHEELHKSSSMY